MQGGAAEEARTPLLKLPAPQYAPQLDWRGRPALRLLGGWKCSVCLTGVMALNGLAFYGILYNLVIYLVQVCGLTNAAAASTVSTLTGTMLVCSFLGAVVSDGYVGRLWTALIFQIVSTLLYGLINCVVIAISQGPATAITRSFLLVSLYLVGIAYGPTLPSVMALGADQLSASEDIEKYFRMLAIMMSIGQLLAASVVTYVDNMGLWDWGFGLSTASSIASTILIAGGAAWFLQNRASGNSFLRNVQVLVAAWTKRTLPLPMDSSLLYECQGNLSAVPGQHKLQHTSTLGCLDKAAILNDSKGTFNPWNLCTVTQVEELKCLLRVLPVGVTFVLSYAANAQICTLFEEQASVMNRQVATWLTIPPASLNVLATGSAVVTGIVIMAGGTRFRVWCFGRRRDGCAQKPASLQLLGVGITGSIIAMAIAALVEGHRLSQVQQGVLTSVMWLMPQTVLLGVCDYLLRSGGLAFFYSEVSESTRAVGGSIQFMFIGAGNYVSSILVSLITVITAQGGQAGWIANDMDEGHVDYFYWFLTCFLVLGLAIHVVYARSYVSAGGASAEDPSNVPFWAEDLSNAS